MTGLWQTQISDTNEREKIKLQAQKKTKKQGDTHYYSVYYCEGLDYIVLGNMHECISHEKSQSYLADSLRMKPRNNSILTARL